MSDTQPTPDLSEFGLRVRTEAEQDAYMDGQRAALELAKRKGVQYAERIIAISQASIRENREQP